MPSFKTKLICISGQSTVAEARTLMTEKRIRHLPVINDNNDIIAMLTSHDLPNHADISHLPVIFFSKAPVQFITTASPLKKAALVMLEQKISSVLLVDDENNVQGIITTDDLLYHLTTLLPGEEPQPIDNLNLKLTVGEFFRRLSDIGI